MLGLAQELVSLPYSVKYGFFWSLLIIDGCFVGQSKWQNSVVDLEYAFVLLALLLLAGCAVAHK